MESILPGSVSLGSDNQYEFLVSVFESPGNLTDVANGMLTFLVSDPALFTAVGGGSSDVVGADGSTLGKLEYQVYVVSVGDEALGLYFQLVNELQLTVLVAPVSQFGEGMSSAQSSISSDDVAVFADADGADFQQQMEAAADRLLAGPAIGGEYTDALGILRVTWTDDWKQVSQDEFGTELTDAADSLIVSAQVVPIEGHTWQQFVDDAVLTLVLDQGASWNGSALDVTETMFTVAMDGQYGVQLVQAMISEDPNQVIFVMAHNFEARGDDAQALLKTVQAAVAINGTPALQGMDSHLADISK